MTLFPGITQVSCIKFINNKKIMKIKKLFYQRKNYTIKKKFHSEVILLYQ